MNRSRWIGLAISMVAHAALVAGLFLSEPPERPAPRRPPTKVRLVARDAGKAPAAHEARPPAPRADDSDGMPTLPAEPPTSVLPTPPPAAPQVAEAPRKAAPEKKTAPPPPRERRERKKKAAESKPALPTPVAQSPAAVRPAAKKFRYEMPAGPGGSVALPTAAPGEGGHRFGAVGGDPDGRLGGRWVPGAVDGGREVGEAAAPSLAPIVDVTETTRAPKLISRPSSGELRRAYPEKARREGREADVQLRVLVNERGQVTRVKVTRKAGHGFDEAATKLAELLRFEPGRRGEQRVRVWVSFPFKFRLNEG